LIAALPLTFCTLWPAVSDAQPGRFPSPYPPYPPGPYRLMADADLKVTVTPKDAAVYVDGYLAGIVDDFDGVFQRLRLEPGGHEIVVFKEGYRSLRQKLYLSPGSTRRVSGSLEPLAAGEPDEAPPAPALPPTEAPPAPAQARGETSLNSRAG
jgi:hypothetical protein